MTPLFDPDRDETMPVKEQHELVFLEWCCTNRIGYASSDEVGMEGQCGEVFTTPHFNYDVQRKLARVTCPKCNHKLFQALDNPEIVEGDMP